MENLERLSFEKGNTIFEPEPCLDFGMEPKINVLLSENDSTNDNPPEKNTDEQQVAEHNQGHKMVTRTKVGIHEPKRYPSEYQLFLTKGLDIPRKPSSIDEAPISKHYKAVMEEEINALKRNNTWSLTTGLGHSLHQQAIEQETDP